jgi:hypothetical protein
MKLSEVEALFDYWDRYPPVNEVLSAVYKVGVFGSSYVPKTVKKTSVPDGCLSVEQLRATVGKHMDLFQR